MRSIKIVLTCSIIVGIIVFFVLKNPSTSYEKSLPEKPTWQMIDFFRDKLFYDEYLISVNHTDGYVYQDGTINETQQFITYAFSPENKLYDYYLDRLYRDEDDKYAYKSINPNDYLEYIGQPTKYNLPMIQRVDDYLEIETAENKFTISTLQSDEGKINVSQLNFARLLGVSHDTFYMSLNIKTQVGESENYLLFLKQDGSNHIFIKRTEDNFEKFLKSEAFMEYSELFPVIDDGGKYLLFNDGIIPLGNKQIIDTENKILFAIDEEDLLSEDGKYVYLNGNSINVLTEGLAEGTQSIQTLENYLADSEADDIVFDLNYKSILKVSGIGGIGTKVSDKHRNVVYFNNELIVISVRYDAIFFGMAGVTNVMIDFSENQDNPKMYILDLSAR